MRQGYGFSNFDNFRKHVLACFSNERKISPQVQEACYPTLDRIVLRAIGISLTGRAT